MFSCHANSSSAVMAEASPPAQSLETLAPDLIAGLPVLNGQQAAAEPAESPQPAEMNAPPAPQAQVHTATTPFTIPNELVHPGIEMLKVSVKRARKVKPRKMWLQVDSHTPADGEMGLEFGVGLVGGQDVRLCWEKNNLLGMGKLHPHDLRL